jgi:hypothetical protein
MKIRLFVLGMLFALSLAAMEARALPAAGSPAVNAAKPVSARKFDMLANKALAAMKQRAAELKIGGVAVVSYAPGESVQGWTSKMAVVGRMKDDPSTTGKGNNLIGIAYAKSAEMAETLQNSGTAKRPPMTGEFGWQGGVIAHTRTGYVIVAFSGGKSEDDVQVSQTGLEILKSAL